MKVQHHVVFSAVFSAALYSACSGWQMAAAAFVSGVLIDVDHLFDYVIEYGVRFDRRKFFRSFEEGQYARIYIVFHAWEWLFILGAAAWITQWNAWIVGILLGGTMHMVADQLVNGAAGLGYSVLWRLWTGFAPARAFPYKKKPFGRTAGQAEAG